MPLTEQKKNSAQEEKEFFKKEEEDKTTTAVEARTQHGGFSACKPVPVVKKLLRIRLHFELQKSCGQRTIELESAVTEVNVYHLQQAIEDAFSVPVARQILRLADESAIPLKPKDELLPTFSSFSNLGDVPSLESLSIANDQKIFLTEARDDEIAFVPKFASALVGPSSASNVSDTSFSQPAPQLSPKHSELADSPKETEPESKLAVPTPAQETKVALRLADFSVGDQAEEWRCYQGKVGHGNSTFEIVSEYGSTTDRTKTPAQVSNADDAISADRNGDLLRHALSVGVHKEDVNNALEQRAAREALLSLTTSEQAAPAPKGEAGVTPVPKAAPAPTEDAARAEEPPAAFALQIVGLSGKQYNIHVRQGDSIWHVQERVARHESVAVEQVQLYHGHTPLGSLEGIQNGEIITYVLQQDLDCRCFVCGQITDEVCRRVADLQPTSLKASVPRFNRPRNGVYPPSMDCFEIPCNGLAVTEAMIVLLDLDIVKQTALELRVMIPACSINEVIVRKNKERGPQLIEAITDAGGDSASVQKLHKFVQRIQELKAEDFLVNGKPRTDGKSWVDDYVATGWRDRLHVNDFLTNFGFTDAFCQDFKDKLVYPGGRDTWALYALRWLVKAVDVFSYQGALSDAVNLIYATLGKPHAPTPSIEQVVETVKEFTDILRHQQWTRIAWRPNYLIHDSELDDILAWLLSRTICSITNSTLACEIQLPPKTPDRAPPSQIDYLQSQYESRSTSENTVIIFRDPGSRNQHQVEYSACFVPPKTVYLVSDEEMRSFTGAYTWDVETSMFKRDSSCLYLHPVSGCWCISLNEASKKHDYFQLRAKTKGCFPHENLGWSMLVRPENNEQNISAPRPLMWNRPDSKKLAIWQDFDSEGKPILADGRLYGVPKPVFHFSISRNPLQRAESPPRCSNPSCASEVRDGWTRCLICLRGPRGHRRNNCPTYIRAKAFMYELGVTEWLDHRWDQCFCNDCHPDYLGDLARDRRSDSFDILPRGWVAFGIAVSRHLPNGATWNNVWTWPSTFHGTRASLLPHILRHSQIGMPGDRLVGDRDGGVLLAKHCAGRQETETFCTSPTIEYAGLQFYATPRQSTSMPGVVGQVALQCHQNLEPHNVIAEHGETLGYSGNNFPPHGVCKYTPLYDDPPCDCSNCKRALSKNRAIEIESNRPDLCVIRRVLIRTFNEIHPPTQTRWQGHQQLTPVPGQCENFRSPIDPPPGTFDDDVIWL